jgi:phosphoribosylformimino-5-aminoimidazole carboxamide ribotide isomerase
MPGSSTFRVIPAVDLKSGRCVTLVGGDPSKRLAERPDPLAAAREWESRGASLLHVIDLDGAIDGLPANRQILMDIVDALEIPVQFGGGIRSVEAARDLLEGGVHRVILGTLALRNPGTVGTLSREYGPGRIMVALDFRGGRVLTHGWSAATDASPIAAAVEYERLGAGSILHTNVEVEGRLRGLPLEPVRELVRAVNIDVVAAGGISTIGDILEIRSTGAAAVVVGAAIYTGRIDLEEAIKIAEG